MPAERILSRKKAHRDHLIRNMVTSLLLYEKVDTTLAKAKELKREADTLIGRARVDSVPNRRAVSAIVFDQKATKKMFEVLTPRYANRAGGYCRITKLGTRPGDGAETARVELIDRLKVEKIVEEPVKTVIKTKTKAKTENITK